MRTLSKTSPLMPQVLPVLPVSPVLPRLGPMAVPMVVLVLLALLQAVPAAAAPIVPTHDGQVIEHLVRAPRVGTSRDPEVAVQEAQALLAAARRQGEPRLAGRALARLAPWQGSANAPVVVLLTLADIEQYLHRFDTAIARLQGLLQRDPRQPQAWLMLATLQRGQGRYAASDQACRALQGLQVPRLARYAEACLAENQALRGQHDPARNTLQALLADADTDADGAATRAWLFTTLAELEQRAARPAAAEAAWRRALQAGRDGYATLGYADLLLDQQRPLEAWQLLQPELRSDAVLLRLAIAARRAQRPEADALRAEVQQRFAQADQRPEDAGHQREGASSHHRERALMALDVQGDVPAALAAARRNVALQREPLDLWLLARCAIAADDHGARRQARDLMRAMGYRDDRLAAL